VTIIINCAGDVALAKRLYQFLSKSVWMYVAAVAINNDQIMIESGLPVLKKSDVRWLVEAYLALNEDVKKYSITESGKILTIRVTASSHRR
jgi:hypothetical protein